MQIFTSENHVWMNEWTTASVQFVAWTFLTLQHRDHPREFSELRFLILCPCYSYRDAVRISVTAADWWRQRDWRRLRTSNIPDIAARFKIAVALVLRIEPDVDEVFPVNFDLPVFAEIVRHTFAGATIARLKQRPVSNESLTTTSFLTFSFGISSPETTAAIATNKVNNILKLYLMCFRRSLRSKKIRWTILLHLWRRKCHKLLFLNISDW